MTDDARSPSTSATVIRTVVRTISGSWITLWLAFVLAHLWLGMLNLFAPGLPLGDVTYVYKFWTDQALVANFWVGIDSVWVYPILALFPMLAAFAFGPSLYASTWLTMVMILNAGAFAMLTGWGAARTRTSAAWWWIAFLILLGPIALGRIDSITIPLAIVGVLLLSTRPMAAAVVLTIATWTKVWPAALLAAIVIAGKDRRVVVTSAAVTSAVIIGIALSFGAGANIFSFITQQTGRGLQIEAPVSTLWLWLAKAGDSGAYVYYDQDILTYQVAGPGVGLAGAIMTPLLGLVSLLVCGLGVLATRRGWHAGDVLPPLALALVVTLVAFNKVGSPQFMSWLAVPVILGLVTHSAGDGRSFRIPAVLALVLAAFTQAIYPYLYASLLNLNTTMLVLITLRNALTFVLLAWAVSTLVRLAWPRAGHDRSEEHQASQPELWPLTSPLC